MSRSNQAVAADLHGAAFEYSGDATPPLGKFTKFMNGEHTPDGSIGEQSDELPNSQASAGRKERNNEERRARKSWSKGVSPDRNNRVSEQFVGLQDAQEPASPEVPTNAAPAEHIGSSQENAPVLCSQDIVMSCDDAALMRSLEESLMEII